MSTRLPKGPALVYIGTDGRRVPVDREPVPDRRERRILRALLGQATELADKADTDDTRPKITPGFQPPNSS